MAGVDQYNTIVGIGGGGVDRRGVYHMGDRETTSRTGGGEMKSVYLGGTISPAPEHNEWRRRVKEWAYEEHFYPRRWPFPRMMCEVIDPTSRNDMRNVTADGLHDTTMPDSLFVQADIADIERCDVLMVVYWKGDETRAWREARSGSPFSPPTQEVLEDNICGCISCGRTWHGFRRQSIGTWAEFGIAAHLGKPIVVISDDPSVTEHPFVRTLAAGIYTTLEDGLKALEVLVR